MIRILLIFAIALPVSKALAGEWKMRAREHYEIHKVKSNTEDQTFKGLSNTINLWYEEPLKWSLGLAAGPVIGSARPDEGEETVTLGSKVRLYTAGVEYKFFPAPFGMFFRLGAGWAQLQTNGTVGDLEGYHGYAGIGYEIWLTDKFTTALEFANRWSELEDDVSVSSITPSIGFHFYKNF